jgi:hypothetical protein
MSPNIFSWANANANVDGFDLDGDVEIVSESEE